MNQTTSLRSPQQPNIKNLLKCAFKGHQWRALHVVLDGPKAWRKERCTCCRVVQYVEAE